MNINLTKEEVKDLLDCIDYCKCMATDSLIIVLYSVENDGFAYTPDQAEEAVKRLQALETHLETESRNA